MTKQVTKTETPLTGTLVPVADAKLEGAVRKSDAMMQKAYQALGESAVNYGYAVHQLGRDIEVLRKSLPRKKGVWEAYLAASDFSFNTVRQANTYCRIGKKPTATFRELLAAANDADVRFNLKELAKLPETIDVVKYVEAKRLARAAPSGGRRRTPNGETNQAPSAQAALPVPSESQSMSVRIKAMIETIDDPKVLTGIINECTARMAFLKKRAQPAKAIPKEEAHAAA